MPEENEKSQQEIHAGRFDVDGRTAFTWTADDGTAVLLPLRVELGVLLDFEEQIMTRSTMFEFLSTIADEATTPIMRKMDGVDFDHMGNVWREVYFDGVSLGESSASSS